MPGLDPPNRDNAKLGTSRSVGSMSDSRDDAWFVDPKNAARLGQLSGDSVVVRLGQTSTTSETRSANPGPSGFQLGRYIETTGCGSVWEATGPSGQPVHLRFVSIEEPGDGPPSVAPLARFETREGLLSPFSSWRQGGQVVLATDAVGVDLLRHSQTAIAEGRPGLPFDEVLHQLAAVAETIDALCQSTGDPAAQGPMDLFVRPENLILQNGRVDLADLRLANPPGRVAAPKPITAYAAPEHVQGRFLEASNQYALAVTYCQLRGGRLPFAGEISDLLVAKLLGDPDLSMLPEPERPAIARALARSPEDRWVDCRGMIQGLWDSVYGAPRPAARPTRSKRPTPLLWGMMAASVLVAMAVTIYALSRRRAIEDQPRQDESVALGPLLPPPPPILFEPRRPVDSETQLVEAVATEPRFAPSPPPPPLEAVPTEPLLTETPRELPPVPPPPPPSAPVGPTWEEIVAGGWDLWQEILPTIRASEAKRVAERGLARVREARRAEELAFARERLRNDAVRVSTRWGTRLAAFLAAQTPPPTPPPAKFRTSTVRVLMPTARSELVVRGEVGRGNPDEWYGDTRIIHTPPLGQAENYLVGTFWTLPESRGPQTRTCPIAIEPGRTYEVNLRVDPPVWKEVERASSLSPTR